MQRLKKILAQKAAPKLPEWPSYGNFRNVTQDLHFLKKCKGGTQGNFSKIAQKVALDWKEQNTLAQITLSSIYYALKVLRLEKILAQKGIQKCPNG